MTQIIIQVADFEWAFIAFANTFFGPTTWPLWFIVFLLIKLLRAIDTLILLIEEKSGETYASCDDCYEITNDFSRCSLCCEIACEECGNKELTECPDESCFHAVCDECHEKNSYQVCTLKQDESSYAHSYNC